MASQSQSLVEKETVKAPGKTDQFYTREEVAKHNSLDHGGRVWVTFKDGIYDVTNFIPLHPGGKKTIMLAAGKSVEPFWAMYESQHYTPQVMKLIAKYRIGTLRDHRFQETRTDPEVVDQYENEPERVHNVPVHERRPYNAGTIVSLIPDNYITPAEITYVRNHHAVPLIDPSTYELTIGDSENPVTLSLNDLEWNFQPHEIVATMICSGYRRREFNNAPHPIQGGVRWEADAVSTARWTGVLLRDLQPLIENHSTRSKDNEFRHVWFVGSDEPYDASVPVEKAFSAKGDVIVAYEMNGGPIPRDHGGPVRMVIPGHAGARSVKWLKRIKASDEESKSPWQRGPAYKVFGAMYTADIPEHPELTPSIQEVPVQSAISRYEVIHNAASGTTEIEMKGWAWSGGGRRILRVETSVDGGKTWMDAELQQGRDQPSGRAWAWTFWTSRRMAIAKGHASRDAELVVRALDESFNVQPERVESIWNIRGNLNNSYHRVRIADNEEDHNYADDDGGHPQQQQQVLGPRL